MNFLRERPACVTFEAFTFPPIGRQVFLVQVVDKNNSLMSRREFGLMSGAAFASLALAGSALASAAPRIALAVGAKEFRLEACGPADGPSAIVDLRVFAPARARPLLHQARLGRGALALRHEGALPAPENLIAVAVLRDGSRIFARATPAS